MKKIILKIALIILFIIIGIILLNTEIIQTSLTNSSKEKYGQPISSEGIINNDYFNIKSNFTDAEATTKGINDAIKYATDNGVKYIKLSKGEYLIDGASKDDILRPESKGICLKSNLTLDLGGSTIKQIKNDKTNYCVFCILNEDNITVKNGIIKGDKEEHIDDNGVNDKGFAFDIRGSTNIVIDNIHMSEFTGEGVLIRELDVNEKTIQSQYIDIKNCIITNNRRQGISIVSGSNINIHDNEIYSIAGRNPQACIDLETDGWAKQKNNNINIYNNKLYNSISNLGIMVYSGFDNGKIYNNEITGRILICNVDDNLLIENNTIYDGGIVAKKDYYGTNNKFTINKLIINNNKLKDSKLQVEEPQYFIIQNNNLEDTTTSIIFIKGAILKNQSNSSINILNKNEEQKELYYLGNNFLKPEISDEIKLNDKEEEINEFIQEVMLGVE